MSMKYDAGMTQYHDDIVSALQDMLHGEIDKIAELAAEGSPVPLREYLRNNHGKAFHGGNRFDAMSSCFLVIFDHVINNKGDSKLDLSWSQVATFIRKYPSDFFKKNEDKEAFPCDGCGYDEHGCCNYPDTPDDYCVMGNKKTSVGIDKLDLDVRSFNALKRAGVNTIADIEAQAEQLAETMPARQWKRITDALSAYKGIPMPGSLVEENILGDELTFDEIAEMAGEIIILDRSTVSRNWYVAIKVEDVVVSNDDHRHLRYYDGAKQRGFIDEMYFSKSQRSPQRAWRVKLQDKPTELPTVQPERAAEVAEKFNYTVLTAELGDYLRHKEEQLRNEYMNFTANCGRIFAEAQEKLAKHGFGESNGVFEKWITSMGFKKSTVYEMIKIHQFRSSEIRTNEQAQLFDSLSKSLQYEVAKPSAPPELVEQVMNGDITTHKEYIELKKQLDEANRKADFWIEANDKTNKENQQLRGDRVIAMKRADNAERRNSELERRVKELESRPVDVAVPDEEEIERLSLEKSKGLLRAKDMECDKRLREMQDESRGKDKEISELKERLMTIGENSEQIENFFEDMYNDAYRALKRCFEFVSESDFTPQTVNKLRLRLNSFSGVVNDFIEEMQQ